MGDDGVLIVRSGFRESHPIDGLKVCMMSNNRDKHDEFPGLGNFVRDMVYRSLGGEPNDNVGIGFMNKSGWTTEYENRTLPTFAVVFCLHGSATFVDHCGHRHKITPGHYLQRIPGHANSFHLDPDSGWQEFFIDLGSSLLPFLKAIKVANEEKIVGNAEIDARLLIEIWRLKVRLATCRELELPLVVGDMLKKTIEILKRDNFERKDEEALFLEKACRYLSEDFPGKRDIRGFCRKNGWSYETFRKRFQERIGISPGQYRIRCRLNLSRDLLNMPRLSIAEIAEKLGYSSMYEFSAQFKKYMGISPTQYRRGEK